MGDRSMSFLTEAILALRPGAQFSTNGDIIIWHDTEQDQPSDSDIAAKEAELQAEYDSQEYARNRKAEYPPMADYLDAIVKDSMSQGDWPWGSVEDFANDYGVLHTNGKFQGLLARSVVIINSDGTIGYTQLLDQTGHEPDYDDVLNALT